MFSASFSHLHLSPLGGLRARIHSSSSVPNFLKFLATVQEHDSPEPKNRYTHTYTVKNLTTVRVPSVDIIAVPHFMNDFNCWTVCYNLLTVNQDLLYIYNHVSVYMSLLQRRSSSVHTKCSVWVGGKSSAQPPPLVEAADLPTGRHTAEEHRKQR